MYYLNEDVVFSEVGPGEKVPFSELKLTDDTPSYENCPLCGSLINSLLYSTPREKRENAGMEG